MANNPYVNKVELADGTPVIDISDTTAVASDVAQGKYFYLATGEKVAGSSTGGGGGAISVVDTPDSHGGTVRTITAVDISDTTAEASDVATGKYFYTADGTKTEGTSSGGGGGGITPAPERDVNFIDYDGTIVYSYSASDFLALSALPANPTHAGLTAQGWNWSLTDAKTYVTSYGKLWIGQMYITSSGDTEIDVFFADKARLSPALNLAVNGSVTVDWGDNTASDTVTGSNLSTRVSTPQHTYANPGDYTIKVHVVTGEFAFTGTGQTYGILSKGTSAPNQGAVYANCVRAIRIGSGITTIRDNAFRYSCSLASITIPNSVTSMASYAFYNCYSLTSITIPYGVASIGHYMFSRCHALANIAFASSVSSVGESAFDSCYTLADITVPSSVTSIGYSSCYSCYNIANFVIPSGVTTIVGYMLYSCWSLASITIPSSVTQINSNAFQNCYGVAEYHFEPTTPPTLANANAFTGIPSDCVMYVPYSADHSILEAYKTATNWSGYASYMQEE